MGVTEAVLLSEAKEQEDLAGRRLQIMGGPEIARRTAGCDLVDWVMDRAR